jgi:hypothetical protein
MDLEKIGQLRERAPLSTKVPGFEPAPWHWETFPARGVPTTDGKPRVGNPVWRIYTERVRAAAWCDDPERLFAVVYEDEVAGLTTGDQGLFFRFKHPKSPIPVTLSGLEPRNWDHVTFSLVFLVDESTGDDEIEQGRLEVGEMGWVEMPNRVRKLLSIHEDALVMSGRERYVLLARPDGNFLRRRVHVGTFDNGYATLLEGLSRRDSVVVGGAFFPDVGRTEFPTIGDDNDAQDAFFTGDRRSSAIGDH